MMSRRRVRTPQPRPEVVEGFAFLPPAFTGEGRVTEECIKDWVGILSYNLAWNVALVDNPGLTDADYDGIAKANAGTYTDAATAIVAASAESLEAARVDSIEKAVVEMVKDFGCTEEVARTYITDSTRSIDRTASLAGAYLRYRSDHK